MNNKQRKVLHSIFTDPIQANIKWADIENLLSALGTELKEGRGSRLRVSLNGVHWLFHRPHPETIAGRNRVKDVRTFLENTGVTDVNT